ncbi:50S ribosomal protein L16 [Candidatus Tremblaya phenacola]|uniref:50S ribosomal protein L16 n=1 Tax=Candidatus Tremblayella phenacoccinincola TaxID=1010676 RepID=UPI00133017FE|nr:50S ribosomal protein L16 [Candidatus Tremblaya phenacola]KAH0998259.1 LSU ribosomal protein L16p [Candidatus Tremblaya phenacola]
MLQPRKRKFRKDKKGRNKGIAQSGNNVSFGEFGLKSVSRGRITSKQIEAARRSITHHLKRGGKVLIRVFPDKPITKKPAEVRMGNGKGNPEHYVFVAQPGKVLYEICGTEPTAARKALKLAAAKLPLKTMFVCRA